MKIVLVMLHMVLWQGRDKLTQRENCHQISPKSDRKYGNYGQKWIYTPYISLHSINSLVFTVECVHCAVRAEFLSKFAKLRKATISLGVSVCLSVRPSSWSNPAPTSRIYMSIFENLSRKFKFHWNLKTKRGTLREDRYTFLIISS